ncbi:LysR family transcriptional regulator [Fodinisporobacter ferrooxydans]|uniref:LysR family transcriptional regulator n=1 Tax=Fodinisporobacter ferrooxydans TaxID=2901836 RepID=A0ABY4CJ85_9BACL|nr:LysR family transcriptional regulator [Alicyclobacillaceae bacterium MYW30-H2]
MELRQLLYALKVAEHRSFSKAAESLHIAQPSLSQQVAKLEQGLGVQLFDRTNTPLEPTYAGERFVLHAAQVLDKVEQIQSEMRDLADMKNGRLILGSLPMTGSHVLPAVLSIFCDKYPGIEVVLIEETTAVLEELTAKGKTDLALLTLPVEQSQLDWIPLVDEAICLAVPAKHRLAKEGQVDVKELKDESFIFLKKGQGFRQISHDICTQAGFEPHVIFESSNIDTVQSLVGAGMGIAFVPEMVKKQGSGDPLLPHYLALLPEKPTRTLICAYKKGRYLSKAAQAFVEILTKSI